MPRVLQAGELRQQVVERGERGGEEAADHEQVAAGDLQPRRRDFVLVVVFGRLGVRRPDRCRRRVSHARARASIACTTSDTRRASGSAAGAAARTPSASASPADEVDHVVLAEVDERGSEERGVGPAQPARDAARLGQNMRGRYGRGEVQRRHGSKRISSQDTVQRGPAGPPELLAVLDHHAPQLGRAAVLHVALGGGVPGRSGRDRPVADQPDVERRVDPRGAAVHPLGVAQDQVQDGPVREREPDPVRPHEQLLPGAEAAGGAERALQAQRRRHAAADQLVDLHRVGDLHPPHEPLGIVVGHLVGRDVGEHLQQAGEEVTRARARHEHAQRHRSGSGRGHHDSGPQLQAAANEWGRHAGGKRGEGGRTDGGRAAHGAGE